MTAPINPGIKFGFPPQILVFGSETPTATVYTNQGISIQSIVPVGVTRMMFEVWGSGAGVAAPGAGTADIGTSGGYAMVSAAVQPGDIIILTLGAIPITGNGQNSSVSVNGTVVCLARGGGQSTTQVGDLTLLPTIGVTGIDTTTWTTPIKPGAPRGAGASYAAGVVASEAGSTPGGGGYAVNGGGSGNGGTSMIIVYTPQPLSFA